jgi:hypothetical protein
MKVRSTFRAALGLAFALTLWSVSPSVAVAEDGFVPLFNGRNLDGWVNVNCAPETWTVRDEMIVCSGVPTGVLRTVRQYQNYVLELEWKHLHERGNAGLFLHSDAIAAPGQPFTRSIEVQILDGNHGDVFSIHGATLTPKTPHPRERCALCPPHRWPDRRANGIITVWSRGTASSLSPSTAKS